MSAYSLFQLAPGVTLQDRYEIQDTNRAGSMSAAFRATDNTDGSACEIQAFPSGLFENVEQAEEFAAVIAQAVEATMTDLSNPLGHSALGIELEVELQLDAIRSHFAIS